MLRSAVGIAAYERSKGSTFTGRGPIFRCDTREVFLSDV